MELIEEEVRYCAECYSTYGIESHHIVYRKHCKSLENCKHNLVDLCYIHHRDHKKGIHHNKELNRKYKLIFQNYMEIHFLKEYLTKEEIKEVLEISEHPLDKLLSGLITHNSKYNRNDLIRLCMGGRTLESEVTNEQPNSNNE